MDQVEMYCIWSNEHNAWWKPNHSGYTSNAILAGRYSLAEALAICNQANYGWDYNRTIPNELPIPSSITPLLKRAQ